MLSAASLLTRFMHQQHVHILGHDNSLALKEMHAGASEVLGSFTQLGYSGELVKGHYSF